MPRLKRHCTTCGKKLDASDVAAEVQTKVNHWFWCLPCWDDPNDAALHQYQAAQTINAGTGQ